MEVQSFTSRNRKELNPDIMMCLNELERKLAKYFDRVEIRGKRSRMVPVLLTPDMVTAMNLLMENRSKCQVPTENVYLFARPDALSHYRGSDSLRKYAKQCGAKNPEALTSTRLRKQVATLSTVLNLKENEMDQLATFLEHDVRIHREFYRLPESTIQLAKVSKLLIAMEKGKLSDLQGKGLDDIDVHPDDMVAMTDNDSDEETIADLHQQSLFSSRTETSGDPKHPPESTTLRNMEATSDSVMLDHLEGTETESIVSTEPADSQQDTAINVDTSLKCSNKKQAGKVRSKWRDDEVKAVERHMLHFITSCKVPEFEAVAPVKSVLVNQRRNRVRSRAAVISDLMGEMRLCLDRIRPKIQASRERRRKQHAAIYREKARMHTFLGTSLILLQKINRDMKVISKR